jgi:hypothetical protein
MRDLDVIVLHNPSVEVVKISISCNLSVFSSKAGSQRVESGGAAPEGWSSANNRELWSGIDKLDEINHGGAFVENLPGGAPREQSSSQLVVRANKHVRPMGKGPLMDDAPGPSTVICFISARNKATWILSAVLELSRLACGGRH